MSDLKKLFKRDRFYWGIMTVIMTVVVTYMLVHVYGAGHKLFYLEDYLRWSRYLHEVWDARPELSDPAGLFDEIQYMFLERMVSVTVVVALIAQAVRLLTQETQNRAEVLRIFPVKSRSRVTCHYLSGLFTVGIPLFVQMAILRLDVLYVEKNTDFIFSNKEQLWIYAGEAMIIFMLHYALLILCRKVTNHVPGTIFTFVVMELGMLELAGYCLDLYWNNLMEDRPWNWMFWAIVTIVLILLSYIADRKQDYARNGVYAFTIVHWVMMGIVFGEIFSIFPGGFEDLPPFNVIPRAVSYFVAITVALLTTAGIHLVTKPKK